MEAEITSAATKSPLQIRRLVASDSLESLTELLHRAYAPLAARGMHYVACTQSVETTRRRTQGGECYVAVEDDGGIVGTIVFVPHTRPDDNLYYGQPHVAWFEQFAVEPAQHGRGIGLMLLKHVEHRAARLGASVIALDTSERADHLIAFYERRGYRIVASTTWEGVNYHSVIMEKALRSQSLEPQVGRR